ncbi:MAG: hypothetical protein EXR62_15705 [Chloroflexi bacterium]|nr:hypothetical protein [Chloroflexota bacterium]
MEQIIIQVTDKEKGKMLSELLMSLDFVRSVEIEELEDAPESGTSDESSDFNSLAGLWEGREISLEMIRQKAWPRLRR